MWVTSQNTICETTTDHNRNEIKSCMDNVSLQFSPLSTFVQLLQKTFGTYIALMLRCTLSSNQQTSRTPPPPSLKSCFTLRTTQSRSPWHHCRHPWKFLFHLSLLSLQWCESCLRMHFVVSYLFMCYYCSTVKLTLVLKRLN